MRVLVVDQDSAMLEAIVRSLRERYTIDAVSNKGDCLDLLRQNAFEVIVAGERLADGSGLELLGQVAKRWPSILRIFSADRHRLQLLKGRLGPFELFQTLSYPIRPELLESVLMLADAAQEADADTSNIQHVVLGGDEEPEEADPFPPPQPQTRAASSEGSPARAKSRGGVRQMPQQASRPPTRGATRTGSGDGANDSRRSEPGHSAGRTGSDRAQHSAHRSGQRSTADGSGGRTASGSAGRSAADSSGRRSAMDGSGQRSAAEQSSRSADRSDRRSTPPSSQRQSGIPGQRSSADGSGRGSSSSSSRSSRGALAIEQEVPADALPLDTHTPRQARKRPPVQFPVLSAPSSSGPARFVPPLPPETDTVDSLADAVEMARHARSNMDSSPQEAAAKRTAFLISAGAAVGLALLVLGFKLFGTHAQPAPQAAVAVSQAPQYPAEVTDLIAQIETAFQQDDFQDANADVEKLRQLAPSHPRLPFFASLLAKHGDIGKSSASTSARPGELGQAGNTGRDSVTSRTAQTPKRGMISTGAPQAAPGDLHVDAPLGLRGTRDPDSNAAANAAPRGTSDVSSSGASMREVVPPRGTAADSAMSSNRGSSSSTLSNSADMSLPGTSADDVSASGTSTRDTSSHGRSAGATSTSAAPLDVSSAPGVSEAPHTIGAGTADSTAAGSGVAGATSTSTNATGTKPIGATGAANTAVGVSGAATTSPTGVNSAGTTSTGANTAAPGIAGPDTTLGRGIQHASTSARHASFDEPPPVVREPKLIRQVNASYPSAAKHDGIEGSVDLNVTISKDGAVTDVAVAQATPPGVFDQSALAAIRRYKYEPRFEDGLPVEAHITVHLDFKQGQDAR